MSAHKIDVVGIGNAIVDVLAGAAEDFLEHHGLSKGSMTLIDAGRAETLYAEMQDRVECSGGSAANTMVGIASLGGSSAYIGKVRDDTLGRLFGEDIRAAGVAFDTRPAPGGPPTGRSLILVTPDAQRTMQTFLGASATLAPDDLDTELVRAAGITYLEGYLWDPPAAKQAFLQAASIAHGADRQVALSLSDPFCVDRHRDEFRKLVERHVDIVLGNEAELKSLYETESLSDAVDALREACSTAVVTRSEKGAIVLSGGETFDVAAEPVEKVVDTTGAGDLFASGFLFGLAHGREPAECGRIGAVAAAEIISHIGARPETSLAGKIGG